MMSDQEAFKYMRDNFPDKFKKIKKRFCPIEFDMKICHLKDCYITSADISKCEKCWDKAIEG